MQCNGKCHLKKELKKVADEETKKSGTLKCFETIEANIQQVEIFCFADCYVIAQAPSSAYLASFTSPSFKITTPPPQN